MFYLNKTFLSFSLSSYSVADTFPFSNLIHLTWFKFLGFIFLLLAGCNPVIDVQMLFALSLLTNLSMSFLAILQYPSFNYCIFVYLSNVFSYVIPYIISTSLDLSKPSRENLSLKEPLSSTL